jgi:hypothetical protein
LKIWQRAISIGRLATNWLPGAAQSLCGKNERLSEKSFSFEISKQNQAAMLARKVFR